VGRRAARDTEQARAHIVSNKNARLIIVPHERRGYAKTKINDFRMANCKRLTATRAGSTPGLCLDK
jgi:hypothetical protein